MSPSSSQEGHVSVASLVRKTLGLKNHRVVKVVDDHGRVVVWLDRIRRRRLPCSVCGTFDPVKDRLPERSWRHVPLWGLDVELRYRSLRVHGCSLDSVVGCATSLMAGPGHEASEWQGAGGARNRR